MAYENSPLEINKIVSDRAELFQPGDSCLHSLVGRLHIHSTGQAGFLVYGPYTGLDRGLYLISLFGQGTHYTGTEWFDLIGHYNHERHELLHENLLLQMPGSWRIERLIKIDSSLTDFEIRVWVAADTEISLAGIEIKSVIL